MYVSTGYQNIFNWIAISKELFLKWSQIAAEMPVAYEGCAMGRSIFFRKQWAIIETPSNHDTVQEAPSA
jgi:hypothetical protein